MKSIFVKGAGQGRFSILFTAAAAGCFYIAATTHDEGPQAMSEIIGGMLSVGAIGQLTEKINDPSGEKRRTFSSFTL